LTDLDDYLAPAQDCIVLDASKSKAGKAQISMDDELTAPKKPSLIKQKEGETKASVNLYDCLACSGCVTSSEVVLMEQHGIKNFIELMSRSDLGIVLITPQSRLALCQQLKLKPGVLMYKLEKLLKKHGATFLFDLQFFIDLHQSIHYRELQTFGQERPLICSECPGWICYVEKVVKEPIINLCSRVKTPQMLAGEILKRLFVESGYDLKKIAVASINPCHDKKLESFRMEGMLAQDVRSLDVVLSTVEVSELIDTEKEFFDSIEIDSSEKLTWQVDELIAERFTLQVPIKKEALDSFKTYTVETHPFYTGSELLSTSTSNNYVNQLFIKAVFDKTGAIIDESSIKETLRRNKKGYGEVEVSDPGSGVLLKGARVYGFKNIQNLIRQIKTSTKNTYSYIELMACPGGCFNGGGQIRGKDHNLEEINLEYEQILKGSSQRRYFFENKLAAELADLILANKFGLAKRETIQYDVKPLVATDNPVFMKW